VKPALRQSDDLVVDVLALPPLTGSAVLDPWRIRHRLALAGQLEDPRRREGPTLSERMLWNALEGEPDGWLREYATGPYRLDFYCPAARLAVEVDGSRHYGRQAAQRDDLRDEWHRLKGITTMRVSADHVERDVAGVVDAIRLRLQGPGAAAGRAEQQTAEQVEPAEVAVTAVTERAPSVQGSGSEPDVVTVSAPDGPPDGTPLTAEAASPAESSPTVGAVAAACRTVLPEHLDDALADVLRQAGSTVLAGLRRRD
jgi:very-short-patch-repair endonuclease